jgi:polysaccharide pyruvyl transferase WcaK-like protein
MKTKNAVVHGSYFANNFGDTLLVNKTIDLLKELGLYEKFYTAVEVFGSEGKSIAAEKFKFNDEYDLIYAGGGYLGENALAGFFSRQIWGFRNILRHYAWRIGKPKPKKVVYLCVGFGPISNPLYRYIAMKDLEKADLVIFRDDASANLYKEYGGKSEAIVLCDLVLVSGRDPAQRQAENCDRKNEEFKLGIHLQNAPLSRIAELAEAIKESVISERVNVKYIVLFDTPARRSDLIVSELKKCLGSSMSIELYSDEASTRKVLKNLNCVISSKLHVGIVSIVEGVSVASFPEHSKTVRLYQQLGLANRVLERGEYSHDRAVEIIRRAISQPIPEKFDYVISCRNTLCEKLKAVLK